MSELWKSLDFGAHNLPLDGVVDCRFVEVDDFVMREAKVMYDDPRFSPDRTDRFVLYNERRSMLFRLPSGLVLPILSSVRIPIDYDQSDRLYVEHMFGHEFSDLFAPEDKGQLTETFTFTLDPRHRSLQMRNILDGIERTLEPSEPLAMSAQRIKFIGGAALVTGEY